MFEETPSHSGAIVPTQPSTCSGPQKPQVPARIGKMIAELGIRFPPTSQTDIDAHARRLALLAQDLADMPADILEKAIDRYVKIPGSNFLPKASQLVEIGRAIASQANQQPPSASSWKIAQAELEKTLQRIARVEFSIEALNRLPEQVKRIAECQDLIRRDGDREYVYRKHTVRNRANVGSNHPLSPEECAAMAGAVDGSLSAAFFRMGRSQGWIVQDSSGGWKDSASYP